MGKANKFRILYEVLRGIIVLLKNESKDKKKEANHSESPSESKLDVRFY